MMNSKKVYGIMVGYLDDPSAKLVMGYHYEPVDYFSESTVPLLFNEYDDAYSYLQDILTRANKYFARYKGSVNQQNCLEEIKEELEIITSSKKSIILSLLMDKINYNGYDEPNEIGFYSINLLAVPL